MEDYRIKISVLWLFAAMSFLAHQILVLMEPGIIAQLMAGEAEGQRIGPAKGWGIRDPPRSLCIQSIPNLTVEGVPQENALALPFEGGRVQGIVTFHDGFSAKENGDDN